ncbi:zinc finger and BTB domain-containing protein 1-like [Heptranchias perlo]|uniref:zinc finger and BTB domain-containing protein 1-like n=1 Tax=Heptranchias perlo TaxID=212740 RepID=UPI00355A6A83
MQPISHSDHVLQQLCSQLEYGFLCDCSIAVGDVYFRAHRVVLAACSSYFHKLFVNQPAETSQLSLSSQAVSPDHFDLILQLMYTGRLKSSPADPERFRASLNFLKLYNAPRFFRTVTVGEWESEERVPAALGSEETNQLVFGVQLCRENEAAGEALEPSLGQNHPASVTVKAETPEDAAESRSFLCRLCGLGFDEHWRLRDHLQLHAQQPFRCLLCGLVFDGSQQLQEHVCGCGEGYADGGHRQEEKAEKLAAHEVKQEAEPAERVGGDDCPTGQTCGKVREGASKDLGPDLKKPKLEEAEEEGPPVLLLRGCEAEDCEAEDYELEEGEVRFPGDDDLVLENASDDGSFSSSDSSLEADSACEGSARTEPSEDEGAGAVALPDTRLTCHVCGIAFKSEERYTRHAARHSGKAYRCRACEGCRPSGEWPAGAAGQHATSQLGAARGGRANGVATRSSLRGSPGDSRRQRALREQAEVVSGGRGRGRGRSKPTCAPHFAQGVERKQHRVAGARKRNVPRKHFCSICEKGFIRRGHLTEHVATHGKGKQFPCQTCGREFLRQRELRLHLAMHTGKARYECQFCGQGSYRKNNHLRHVACHLTEGQAICQVCFEILRNEEELTRHLESHLYPCRGCGEKFRLKKEMATHAASCWMKKLLDTEPAGSQRDED